MPETNPFLVSADWLAARLKDENITIVDGSWYLPDMNREPKVEYDMAHIPGAVFFDIDAITEPGSDLPHTLASPEVFSEAVGAMGISDKDTIVVYDGMGLFSAPRVWWNFRVMGAAKTIILDGGLPRWIEDRLPIESGTAPIKPKTFNAAFDASQVVPFEDMQKIVAGGSREVADARPADRFSGQAPEPRPGIRSGHMPGSHNVPFLELAEEGKLKSANELKQVFEKSNLDLSRPIVTSCGSGVTAAALILALETIGHKNYKLYDGSWAEWGGRDDTEVVTD